MCARSGAVSTSTALSSSAVPSSTCSLSVTNASVVAAGHRVGAVAGRRTNLALLGLATAAVATGAAAFAVGSPGGQAVAIAHGVAGLAIVLLAPWKSLVVRRSLTRPARRGRTAALWLAALSVVAVLS